MLYVQCKLRKQDKTQIAWIPNKFAMVGAFVRLKNGDHWEGGWEVVQTYASQNQEFREQHERDYKHLR